MKKTSKSHLALSLLIATQFALPNAMAADGAKISVCGNNKLSEQDQQLKNLVDSYLALETSNIEQFKLMSAEMDELLASAKVSKKIRDILAILNAADSASGMVGAATADSMGEAIASSITALGDATDAIAHLSEGQRILSRAEAYVKLVQTRMNEAVEKHNQTIAELKAMDCQNISASDYAQLIINYKMSLKISMISQLDYLSSRNQADSKYLEKIKKDRKSGLQWRGALTIALTAGTAFLLHKASGYRDIRFAAVGFAGLISGVTAVSSGWGLYKFHAETAEDVEIVESLIAKDKAAIDATRKVVEAL